MAEKNNSDHADANQRPNDGGSTADQSNEQFAKLTLTQIERLRDARLDGKKLGDDAFVVYAILAAHAGSETGQCFPGMEKIAKLAGKDKRNIKRTLRKLEDAKLIETSRRRSDYGDRDSNLYQLVGVGAHAPPPGGDGAQGVGASAHRGGGDGAQGVGAHAPPKQTNKNRPVEQTSRTSARFEAPTVEQVAAHCRERSSGIDAEQFVAYYTAQGWKLKSGQPMRDWKAAIITWEKRAKERAQENGPSKPKTYGRYDASLAADGG